MATPVKTLQENVQQGDWLGRIVQMSDGSKQFLRGKYTGGSGNSETPVTSGLRTGNPAFDEMVQAMEVVVRNRAKDGQIINTAIDISPEKVDEFLKQAQDEINPYYQSQFKIIKNSLNNTLGELQAQYNDTEATRSRDFGTTLKSNQTTLGEQGKAVSGDRVTSEKNLVDSTQQAESAAIRDLKYSAQSSANSAEQQIGSKNLQDVAVPQAGSTDYAGGFTPGQTFAQGLTFQQPKSNIFALSGDITGTLEEQQKKDTLLRQQELKNAYLDKMANNTYSGNNQ